MLDWKILAASFAALLVVSTLLIGGTGKDKNGGIFSDLIKKVNEWLGTSPFTGFITSSATGQKHIQVTLSCGKISITPDNAVNLTVDSVKIRNFKGTITTDFSTILLTERTNTELSLPLSNFTIKKVKIGKTLFNGIAFIVNADDLDVTSKNGTIEISDFSGDITFNNKLVFFDGNASFVRGNHRNIVI